MRTHLCHIKVTSSLNPAQRLGNSFKNIFSKHHTNTFKAGYLVEVGILRVNALIERVCQRFIGAEIMMKKSLTDECR